MNNYLKYKNTLH